MKYIILSLIAFCSFAIAKAQIIEQPLISVLSGSKGQLKKDSSFTTEDDKWWIPAEKAKLDLTGAYRIKNIISLKLREDTGAYIKPFKAIVNLKLFITNSNGTLDSSQTQTLVVNYDTIVGANYNSQRNLVFYNAYRVKARILSVDTVYTAPYTGLKPAVTPFLRLENEMQITREYNYTCSAAVGSAVTISSSNLATEGELDVSWNVVQGAGEYDLEWVYIDNQAASDPDLYKTNGNYDPKKIFIDNATRVTITNNAYKIPMIYPDLGVLFVRYRPVQNKPGGTRYEGNWSSDNLTGLGQYASFAGHEPDLNWQSTTSFAEEGKRKSVVQYYDGSLRSRQTVTKDNSNNTTVVAETMYDFQGRPVIQVLPAPTLSNLIAYSRNFNRAISATAYDKSLYDTLLSASDYCLNPAPAMDSNYGASLYYSTINTLKKDPIHRFIPNANNYPFTETRYVQDNSGRVLAQSGVGFYHKIGTGRETKYFYANPDQRELDALFGTEVGYASHYTKNMVRDANGQYSVSYVDMHGRTVATALAGKAPASMDTIPSYRKRTITERLADSTNNVTMGLLMESSRSLLVSDSGAYTFKYNLTTDSFGIKSCANINICYDCLYNLEITITDECNNCHLPGNQPFVRTKNNFSFPVVDTLCNAPVPLVDSFVVGLPEGNYMVTKKLTISKYGMDYYRDSVFLKKNTCRTFADFYKDVSDSLQAQMDCSQTSCDSCTARNATRASFTTYYLRNAGIPLSDSAQYRDDITLAYNESKEECSYICGNAGEYTFIRKSMLIDMTAPQGQYANPDSSVSANRRYNIFDIDNPVWKYVTYRDEYGKLDSALNDQGVLVPINQLSQQQFISSFKESWALDLLPRHPEYPKLVEAEKHGSSSTWDEKFGSVDTYAAAKAKGYLNPTGLSGSSLPAQFVGLNATDRDPLAKTDSLLSNMGIDVFSYISDNGRTFSMWGIASINVKCDGSATCPDKYNNTNINNCFNETFFCTGELDMAWIAFRQQYLARKRAKVMDILHTLYPSIRPNIPLYRVEYFGTSPASNSTNLVGQSQSAITGNLNTQTNQFYQGNCVGYANSWWTNLAPCFLKASDAQRQLDSMRLIPRMVEICMQGSDAAHPFGSSSTAPGSILRYKSFEELIRFYIDSMKTVNPAIYNYDYSCNADLIYAPQDYNIKTSLASEYVFTKPDTCQCNRINTLYTQFKQNGNADANFSAYLLRTQGTSVADADLTKLLNMCSGVDTCRFLSNPIILPPALQCGITDVCVTCTQVQNAFTLFKNKYPGVYPIYDGSDSVQAIKNQTFANFMNHALGFTKVYTDYLDFMSGCSIRTAGDTSRCDSLNTVLTNFQNFYNSINFAQIYSNKRITKCANEMITGINVLINAKNISRQIFTNNYKRAPYSINYDVKLKSVALTDGITKYNTAMLPMSLDCNLLPSLYDAAKPKLLGNNILSQDFVNGNNIPSALSDKYFEVTMEDRNFFTRSMWGAYNDNVFNSTYYYYRTPTPMRKYIFEPVNGPNVNDVYQFALINIPPGTNTPSSYNTYYSNYIANNNIPDGPYTWAKGVPLDSMRRVYNLRFEPSVMPASYDPTQVDARYLKVSADFIDGSTRDLYLFGTYYYYMYYHEVIDTNLYNPNCQKAFTTYYNNLYTTNYTYSQIDSIYFARCGYHPSPCVKTGPTNCDTLRKVVEDYYANSLSIQKDPIDSAETTVFDLLQPYYTPFNNLNNYRVKDYIKNGTTAKMPDSLRNLSGATALHYGIKYLLPMCTGSDITFEFRVKVDTGQQNTAQRNGWGSSELIPELFFDGTSTVVGARFNSTSAATSGFRNPVAAYGNASFVSSFSDWAVIKMVIAGNTASVYKDGILLGTTSLAGRPIRTQLTNYQFGMLTASYYIDWVRIYDGQGALKYQEDFDNIKSFTKPPADWTCATTNCEANFTSYFNTRFGTNLLYKDITALMSKNCGVNFAPCGTNEPLLCGKNEPLFPILPEPIINPCADSSNLIFVKATELYNAYQDSIRNAFDSLYFAKCKNAFKTESFTVSHPVSEYHYTLYYYDQSGNLVKTVPPAGVDQLPGGRTTWLDSVAIARRNGTSLLPAHALQTNYRYNTLNTVVTQKTPDAGISSFWYDRLGRLVLSQNAKQKAVSGTETNRQYSYTLYDRIGRITTVGQLSNATSTVVTQSITSDEAQFNTWLFNATSNYSTIAQVTRTVYDNKYPAAIGTPSFDAKNLRNRVAYTTYTEGNSAANYNSATFYTYDIHGNVDTLLQDYGNSLIANTANVMNSNGSRWKRIVYQYDLISGKVNTVAYQPQYFDGSGVMQRPQDAFYHRYSYDAENRITLVETSADSTVWERDARYSYYKHGPLARAVIGQQMVQGMDYAYTIQGWLKGVNTTNIKSSLDMGKDGDIASPTTRYIARDAIGFNLNYFNGDYNAIFGTNPFAAVGTGNFQTASNYRPLYNGNISSMAVNIRQFNSVSGTDGDSAQLYNYKYDQLNRLVSMDAFIGLNATTNQWASNMVAGTKYKESIRYDANGNILNYTRNGNLTAAPVMDSLTYTYNPGTNQLNWVKDTVAAVRYKGDIDNNQVANNYSYDGIGNLIADVSEGIASINWNVYGKISSIYKLDSSATINNAGRIKQLIYTYDPAGNRISKRVSKYSSTTVDYTWYVKDASGNTMSTYSYSSDSTSASPLAIQFLYQNDFYLFGNARLGSILLNRNMELSVQSVDTTYSLPLVGNGIKQPFMRGAKQYELSNHLGNVLVTVSDKKIGATTNGTSVDYYSADVVTANDYYPGGMTMPGRKYTNGSYRYGFGGMEMNNEIKGNGNSYMAEFWEYDSRLVRRWNVDPKSNIDHNVPLSPYCAMGNNPILYSDPDGQDFGIKIDYGSKTIIFVSNVYTSNKQTYNQAMAAAKQWNSFNKDGKTQFSGYTVKFQVNVSQIPEPTEQEMKNYRGKYNGYKEGDRVTKGEWATTKKWLQNENLAKTVKADQIGNAYYGLDKLAGRSIDVYGTSFTGGFTIGGKDTYMNNHDVEGDLGRFPDLVAHELGHQMGLTDAGGKYYLAGGIMEYLGTYLNKISNDDVKLIIQYAKDFLTNPANFSNTSQVKVIEEKGTKDPNNPTGVK